MAKRKHRIIPITTAAAPPTTTAGQLSVMFVLTTAFAIITVFLANVFLPNHVVLGNNIFSPGAALIYSMITYGLLSVGAVPVVEWLAEKRESHLTENKWMLVWFVVNFFAFWIVARFAELLGLGISSWRVVAVLALIMDILQASIMDVVLTNLSSDRDA